MGIETVIQEVNVVPPSDSSIGWIVEAIDDDGGIERAEFIGPRDRHRADMYASTIYPNVIPRDWTLVRGKT